MARRASAAASGSVGGRARAVPAQLASGRHPFPDQGSDVGPARAVRSLQLAERAGVDDWDIGPYASLAMFKLKSLAVALAVLVVGTGVGCDSGQDRVERWATTENTTVKIDWDKVNEAYKQASGPEDLEKRINEIYEGDEVISVAVHDQDNKSQVVTGFFDKNTNGKVDDGEQIFTIKRELTGEGTAQYQTMGYGPYYGYHSPLFSIASGMLLGSMMSGIFMPH